MIPPILNKSSIEVMWHTTTRFRATIAAIFDLHHPHLQDLCPAP